MTSSTTVSHIVDNIINDYELDNNDKDLYDLNRLDSPAGRERSGRVAGVSLELGRRAAPQGPGVQWRTRGIASTSRGDSSGG